MSEDELFRLTVSVGQTAYAPGSPIEISATLEYKGAVPSVTVGGAAGNLVGFSLQQLDGTFRMGWGSRPICAPHMFQAREVQTIPFQKSGGVGHDAPDFAFWQAWLADPQLLLPAGEYTVGAHLVYGTEDCADMRALDALATFQVTESTGESPLPS